MSRSNTKRHHRKLSFNLIGACLLGILPFIAATNGQEHMPDAALREYEDCSQPVDITPNSTTRGWNAATEECFETFLDSTGFVLLDVSTPVTDAAEAKIAPWSAACDDRTTQRASYDFVTRTAASAMISIRNPGSLAFCIAAQNPEHRLAAYTLHVAFASSGDLAEEGDPDAQDNSDKGGDPDDTIPDPEPMTGGRGSSVTDILCGNDETDDHSDIAACATPIGLSQPMDGTITNEIDDDIDHFTFKVSSHSTVTITTTGIGDFIGALFDSTGNMLAVDDDGGDGENFRIVKTLVPGHYIVRVEGGLKGAAAYRLVIFSE